MTIYKLIFKTPTFDLLEDVKKKFGVVFTPKTPIVEVEKTIKRLYATKHNKKPHITMRFFFLRSFIFKINPAVPRGQYYHG